MSSPKRVKNTSFDLLEFHLGVGLESSQGDSANSPRPSPAENNGFQSQTLLQKLRHQPCRKKSSSLRSRTSDFTCARGNKANTLPLSTKSEGTPHLSFSAHSRSNHEPRVLVRSRVRREHPSRGVGLKAERSRLR